jgi:hypothetical protein
MIRLVRIDRERLASLDNILTVGVAYYGAVVGSSLRVDV